ncbi:MAG TPA: hypothetical protein VMT17_18755 [Anaeromyxobacteraceae bacterium]|nr:hypothetical protein [Anaeromyxobacteraceae bacterium]
MTLSKLLLLSLLVATVGIPVLAARDPNPRRGMKRLFFYTVVFNLFYVTALLTVVIRGI